MTRPQLDPPSGRGPGTCLCACPRRDHFEEAGRLHSKRCGCGEFRPDLRPVRRQDENQQQREEQTA